MAAAKKQEKISVLSSTSRKSYGTASSSRTSNNMFLPTEIVRHEVCQGDTVEGLAVRYGVTAEKIRQENKLWVGDSIFLRKELAISVPRLKSRSSPQRTSNGSSLVDSDESNSSSLEQTVEADGAFDKSSVSTSSYLARFDADLLKTKSSLEHMESTVNKRVEQLGAEASAMSDAAAEAHYRRTAHLSKCIQGSSNSWRQSPPHRLLLKFKGKKKCELEAHHDDLYQL